MKTKPYILAGALWAVCLCVTACTPRTTIDLLRAIVDLETDSRTKEDRTEPDDSTKEDDKGLDDRRIEEDTEADSGTAEDGAAKDQGTDVAEEPRQKEYYDTTSFWDVIETQQSVLDIIDPPKVVEDVVYQAFWTPMGCIFRVTNTSETVTYAPRCKFTAYIEHPLYDGYLYDDLVGANALAPLETAIVPTGMVPDGSRNEARKYYDDRYNYETVVSAFDDWGSTDCRHDVMCTGEETKEGILVTATNCGERYLDRCYVAVVYFDDGLPVGFAYPRELKAGEIGPGQTVSGTAEYPHYLEYGEEIPYEHYEIYVVDASSKDEQEEP